MSIVIYRNNRPKTLFWPLAPGCFTAVASGATISLHEAEAGELLRVLLRERYLIPDDGSDEPALH